MERTEHYIVVTWREEEASPMKLDKDDFEIMKRNMIDAGFSNLQTECYQKGKQQLPDRIVIFVYWESPDSAPEYDLVRKWGGEIATS